MTNVGDVIENDPDYEETVVVVQTEKAGGFAMYSTHPLRTIKEYIAEAQTQLDVLKGKFQQ